MPIVERSVETTDIDGLLVITLKQITDDRGTVREYIRASTVADEFPGVGPWKQINVTESHYGAIRGMHGENMTNLGGVVSGTALGAYVDTRKDSPTAGKVVTVELAPGRQVIVPAGVCNGFQATSEGGTQYLYCFDDEWTPGMAGVAVHPLDPALGIEWPVPVELDNPAQVSAKDAANPLLAEVLDGS